MRRRTESSWLACCARASLSLVLATSLSLPAIAFAGPPEAAPAPAPVQPDPAAQPVPVPQPQPQPYPTDGSRQLHDPFGGQPAPYPAPVVQPQPAPQPQPPPPPVYYYEQPPGYAQPVQPVPPPAPVKPRKKGMGLLVGGLAMFGGTYLFTVLGGTIAIDTGNPEVGRALLVPVVGPFAGFARLDTANDPNDTVALGILGMVFSGMFQLGGLAMGFAGVGLLARSRAEARYGVSVTGDGLQLRF